MNFTLGGVFKIASACIVVASVANVLATEDLSFMFDFKREERYPPLPRRRRKKIQWPTWKSICFWRRNGRKNQRKVTYEEEVSKEIAGGMTDAGVVVALTESRERNSSYWMMDKHQLEFPRPDEILTKFMSASLMAELSPKQTPMGCTLQQVVIPDGNNADLIAGDVSTYSVFREIFNPLVSAENPGYEFGEARYQFSFNPMGVSREHVFEVDFVISIHFMVSRSIKEYRFSSCNTVEEKLQIEGVMTKVFKKFPSELLGSYCSFSSSSVVQRCEGASRLAIKGSSYSALSGENVGTNDVAGPCFTPRHDVNKPEYRDPLFDITPNELEKKPDSAYYERAGINRDWPLGRGVFTAESGMTEICVNRDDHLRLYHTEKSGDLVRGFRSFCNTYREVHKGLQRENLNFAYDNKYGFVNWSPSLIGSSMMVAAKLRLPQLKKHEKFHSLLLQYNLRCNSDLTTESDVVEVSLTDSMGMTEVEMVNEFGCGISHLIRMESLLQQGQITSKHIIPFSPCRIHRNNNMRTGRRFARLQSIEDASSDDGCQVF